MVKTVQWFIYLFFIDYKHIVQQDVCKVALEGYIESGRTIRNGENFNGTPLDILEKIILSPETTLKNKDYFDSPPELNEKHVEKTFIALVAPSFSGKTQSAFSMKQVRPLYFVIDSIKDESQLVYQNFQSLSQHLIEAGKYDYDVIHKY